MPFWITRAPAMHGLQSLREQSGIAALQVSHVAYPNYRFHSPSGKVEFYASRASELGLPPLPVYQTPATDIMYRHSALRL